jgi:hypothetical protein
MSINMVNTRYYALKPKPVLFTSRDLVVDRLEHDLIRMPRFLDSIKIVSSTNDLLRMYSGGGRHTYSHPRIGSAYKARLYGDGKATWIIKEVTSRQLQTPLFLNL